MSGLPHAFGDSPCAIKHAFDIDVIKRVPCVIVDDIQILQRNMSRDARIVDQCRYGAMFTFNAGNHLTYCLIIGDVGLVVDGGTLTAVASTVVDATDSPWRVLRAGAVEPGAVIDAAR